MEKKERVFIYRIYFPGSDKCYIGQTYDLNTRLMSHLNSKYLVGKALRKYDKFEITILHICDTRDEANQKEVEEVKNFSSIEPNGYNFTPGGYESSGFKGHRHSISTKRKMSSAGKGNKYKLGLKRKPFTKEHLVNMSEAQKGNKHLLGYKHPKESKKKMGDAHRGKNACILASAIKKIIL